MKYIPDTAEMFALLISLAGASCQPNDFEFYSGGGEYRSFLLPNGAEFCVGENDTAHAESESAIHAVAKQARKLLGDLDIKRDGNAWCATFGDFTNLQESPAGFSVGTPADAILNLYKEIGVEP